MWGSQSLLQTSKQHCSKLTTMKGKHREIKWLDRSYSPSQAQWGYQTLQVNGTQAGSTSFPQVPCIIAISPTRIPSALLHSLSPIHQILLRGPLTFKELSKHSQRHHNGYNDAMGFEHLPESSGAMGKENWQKPITPRVTNYFNQ